MHEIKFAHMQTKIHHIETMFYKHIVVHGLSVGEECYVYQQFSLFLERSGNSPNTLTTGLQKMLKFQKHTPMLENLSQK